MAADATMHMQMLIDVEDTASSAITAAEASVLAAVEGIEGSLDQLANSSEDALDSLGSTLTDGEQAIVALAANMKKLIPSWAGMWDLVKSSTYGVVTSLAGSVKDAAKDALGSVGAGFKSAAVGAMDFLTKPRDMIGVLKGVGSAGKAAMDGIKNKMPAVTSGLASAAAQMHNMLQGLLQTNKAQKGLDALRKGFKLFSGPLDVLWKLLGPIVSLIADTFTPALDVLKAALANTLAPLSAKLEDIAHSLIPLVQRFMTPVVALLETAAERGGQFLMDAANKLLPAIFDTMAKLQPIMPKLLAAFIKLLDALIPMLPLMIDLAVTLVEKLLAPAAIKGLEFLTTWISGTVVPFVEEWLPAIIVLIGDLADTVSDFFGNLDKHMGQFKVLFLNPLRDGINEVLSMFGLGDLSSQWDKMVAAFMAPLETLKSALNSLILSPFNDMLNSDLFGETLGQRLGIDNFMLLAQGAAAVTGPTPAIIGEAGPEMVLPLKPEIVERTLGPLMPSVDTGGMEEAVVWLKRIHGALTGTLRVDTGGPGHHSGGLPQRNDLGAAVGIKGTVIGGFA